MEPSWYRYPHHKSLLSRIDGAIPTSTNVLIRHRNPRSPDGERPRRLCPVCRVRFYFNPRSPDEERRVRPRCRGLRGDFNPRSPDGERPVVVLTVSTSLYFNPRSPDGERHGDAANVTVTDVFQSTLPGWGATMWRRVSHIPSIHFNPRSPDGERLAARRAGFTGRNFNPRSPDGERRGRTGYLYRIVFNFNPRSPDGERLHADRLRLIRVRISIHAPRMGSDLTNRPRRPETTDFNPRSPDGERPGTIICRRLVTTHFNPRSPDGERQGQGDGQMSDPLFQSTLPGWGATLLL